MVAAIASQTVPTFRAAEARQPAAVEHRTESAPPSPTAPASAARVTAARQRQAGDEAALKAAVAERAPSNDTSSSWTPLEELEVAVQQALQQSPPDARGAMSSLHSAQKWLTDTLASRSDPMQRAALLLSRAQVQQQAMLVQATLNPNAATAAEWSREDATLNNTASAAASDLNQAASALEQMPNDSPMRARLAADWRTLATRQTRLLSQLQPQLALAVGEHAQAVQSHARELERRLGLTAGFLSNKVEQKLDDNGQAASLLQYFSRTTVHGLSEQQVKACAAAVANMPADKKAAAREALNDAVHIATAARDVSALRVAQQLFDGIAPGDRVWQAQAANSKGAFLLQLGNSTAAHAQFVVAEQHARAVVDKSTQKQLLRQAMFGQVSALESSCAQQAPNVTASAATQLTKTRKTMEQWVDPTDGQPLFTRAERAAVTLREAQALVGPHPRGADAALNDAKAYAADLPQLKDALTTFEQNHRTSSAAAFFKTAMKDGAVGVSREHGRLMLLGTSVTSAAVVGAQAGAIAGPLGAGAGVVVGGLVGLGLGVAGNTVASLVYSTTQGNALAAGQTGLTALTWSQTALHSAGVAADLAMGGLASSIGKRVALAAAAQPQKAGVTRALHKEFSPSAGQLEARHNTLAGHVGAAEWAALSPDVQRVLMSKSFLLEAGRAGLAVGALPQVVVMGGEMVHIASQFRALEDQPNLSVAEREQRREQLHNSLKLLAGTLAVGSVVLGGGTRAVRSALLRDVSTPHQLAMQAAIRGHKANTSTETYAARRERFCDDAVKLGASRAQALELWRQSGERAGTDTVTGMVTNSFRVPSLQHAITQATQQQSTYVTAEVYNLGGLNSALGASGANEVYRTMATAMQEAVGSLDVNVTWFRASGPRMAAIATGPQASEVPAALAKAQARIDAEMQARGLATLDHPKHIGDPRHQGVGISVAATALHPNDTAHGVLAQHDRLLVNNSRYPIAIATTPSTTASKWPALRLPQNNAATHQHFEDSVAVSQRVFTETASRAGLSPQQAERLYALSGAADAVDNVTGLQNGAHRIKTVELAREHTQKTGDLALYVELDIRNLSGLNRSLGTEKANALFRAFADTLNAELSSLSAKVSGFRHGGDEMSFVLVSSDVDKRQVEGALARAQSRIQRIIIDNGLHTIEHPKHPGDPAFAGTGVTFGIAAIRPNDTVENIFRAADVQVELQKKTRPTTPAPTPSR